MDNIFGTYSPEPTDLEQRNRVLARTAAAEGFVLLKNENGALPLKHGQKIALYGMGARKTVKGGLGSGSVEERYSVTIEDGLKKAGYEITTGRWLDDYDKEYDRTYQEWHDSVEEKVAGLTDPMKIIPLAHSFVYRYPSGRAVTMEDIRQSGTDTAVYVVMRQAGECNDRRLEEGDYFLTDRERENIQIVADAYEHMILVINVGGNIDMTFLDEISGIDALVLFVQGGEEGGNALADVLSGRINFSGKLADTIPCHYSDIPYGDEFSYLNGNLEKDDYKEDIYVGYRYFDSFGKEVRFPFGFGLSYTSFQIETESVSVSGRIVITSVRVTNIGEHAGKEVVQVYIGMPYGGLQKEEKRLIAFQKTQCLEPGEAKVVEIRFDLAEAASYDEARSAWFLGGGCYDLMIGNSSRDINCVAAITVPEDILIRQCKPCGASVESFPLLVRETPRKAMSAEHLPRLTIDKEAFRTEYICYTEPENRETEEEKALLDGLTKEEMTRLLCGGELQKTSGDIFDIPGTAGKTATALKARGIPNIVFADGPAGVNVINRSYVMPDGTFVPAEVPERYQWGILKTMMTQQPALLQNPVVHRYATAWPAEMLLAQTWNTALMCQIGTAVGEEMKEFGISVWLAPGMNIHRNPLGGRTFEYYSEDPVLTGEMASALINGVQSHKGIGVCVKHFCCNNSEDNRNGISANVSERALREIYLKGFEIVVRKSNPMAVMTSYNRLNGRYTANRYDLLTEILRCEWGFGGVVMTDWGSTNDRAAVPEECAPAGNDLIMPGNPYDRERLENAARENIMSEHTIRRSAGRVLHMILNTLPGKDK